MYSINIGIVYQKSDFVICQGKAKILRNTVNEYWGLQAHMKKQKKLMSHIYSCNLCLLF